MALIKCGECRRDISSEAPMCPGCGISLKPMEIEKTSKAWKKVHLVSWVMIIGGFMLMGGDTAHGARFWGGVNLIIFGIITRYIGKVGAWWSNR